MSITGYELMKAIKTQVKCDLKEKDPEMQISLMISDYLTLLRKLNAVDIIKTRPKLATKHLVEVVRPLGLQQILMSDRNFKYRSTLRKDMLGFIAHTKELAASFEICNTDAATTADSSRSKENKGGRSGKIIVMKSIKAETQTTQRMLAEGMAQVRRAVDKSKSLLEVLRKMNATFLNAQILTATNKSIGLVIARRVRRN